MHRARLDPGQGVPSALTALAALALATGMLGTAARAEQVEVVATGITDNTFVGSGDPCGTGQSGGQACNGFEIVIRLLVETGTAGPDQMPDTNEGYYRRLDAPGFITGTATINGRTFRMPGFFVANFDQLVDVFDEIPDNSFGFGTLDRVQFGISGANAQESFSVSPNFIMTSGALTGDLLDAIGSIAGSPLAALPWLYLSNGSFNFTNATGQVQGQYRISLASFRVVPPLLPLALPDINSNGTREVAVLRGATRTVEIRDGAAGSVIGNIAFFNSDYRVVSAVALPDADGNGISEIAVLGRQLSTLRNVVEIRNITGPQAARMIWFGPAQRPVDFAAITDDADGNGVPELALLARRDSDGRAVVEVRNAFGAATATSIWLSAGLVPIDLEIVPDADVNGVPEVAVLASRTTDGRAVVEIKNAAGPAGSNTVWCASGNGALDLAVTANGDLNPAPELAVLLKRRSDGRGLVEVKNAAGATNPRTLWVGAGNSGLAIEGVPDADASTVPEVAVLARRNSDDRMLAEVRNVAGPTNNSVIWYDVGAVASRLTVLDDLDANGVEEVVPLMVRNSDGRIHLQRRNAYGDPAPFTYWFSP